MSNVFQTCLKGFKLKKFVVVPKMAQLIELDEESVDPHLNRSRSGQGAVEVQRSPAKH